MSVRRWSSETLDTEFNPPIVLDGASVDPGGSPVITILHTYDPRKHSHLWSGTDHFSSEELDTHANNEPGSDFTENLIPEVTRETERVNAVEAAADNLLGIVLQRQYGRFTKGIIQRLDELGNIDIRRPQKFPKYQYDFDFETEYRNRMFRAARWTKAIKVVPTLVNFALLALDFIDVYTWADEHVEEATGYHIHDFLAASAWYGGQTDASRKAPIADKAFRAWLATLDPIPSSVTFLRALWDTAQVSWDILEPEFQWSFGNFLDITYNNYHSRLGEGESRGLRQGGQQ